MQEQNTYNWVQNNNSLSKKFEFQTFHEAMHFVKQVANIAEEIDHHPSISIDNLRFVTLTTTTHSKGNVITAKDYNLIKEIEEMLNK